MYAFSILIWKKCSHIKRQHSQIKDLYINKSFNWGADDFIFEDLAHSEAEFVIFFF